MQSVETIRLGYNSLYYVCGADGQVLVDAGPDYDGAWEALVAALDGPPGRVVITHGHLDHAGLGAQWLAQRVDVALHPADFHLAAGPALATDAEWAILAGFIEEAGTPAGVAAPALAALNQRREWAHRAASDPAYHEAGRDGRWPTMLRYVPFSGPQAVGEGSYVGAGLRVVECPGHTPGNIVLVHDREGWLFSGDQLLPSITPTPAIQVHRSGEGLARFHSLPQFAASLRRLGETRFSRCYSGHGEPFDNVGEVIAANLAQIEQRGERVSVTLRERGAATTYELAEALYPRALARRFWQIIATVQGQLDILEEDGRARREGTEWISLP
ncbi:MBL fold metallo-hydrolase [bacterium]|nr:MBL fold metallo-hydrolase [bacterium]